LEPDAKEFRKAWCLIRYGFNLKKCVKLLRIPVPNLGPDDVKIKIIAAGLNPVDYKIIYGMAIPIFRPLRPFPLGYDFSGIVEEVGKNVSRFKKNDRVFGKVPWEQIGTLTELSCVDQFMIAKAPQTVSLEAAAGLPLVACTGIEAFEYAEVKKSDKILIIGGSGGLGSFLIQFARYHGCHITSTASTGKMEWVKSLGADQVVDYTSKQSMKELNGFDIVLDTVGGTYPYRSVNWLKKGGKCITLAGHHDQATLKQIQFPVIFRLAFLLKGAPLMRRMQRHSITYKHVWSSPNYQRLEEAAALVDQGVILPITDCFYPFEQTIEALRYVQTGRASGKVIVLCNSFKND
jgi:NADPH:quinone reductase-like Zn-dependent oxidoreductase